MSSYSMPKFHPVGLENLKNYLMKNRRLRSLDTPESIPVIKSKCPSLDWITNCGGIPRGRVIVVKGPESSGKCVCLSTFIPVYGRGLIRMQDLANELSWNTVGEEVQSDQHAELTIYVPNAESEPIQTNAMYFAGTLESHRVTTEDGNELVASKTHRVLSLTNRGVLAWVMLRDLRLGDVLVKTVGQKVSGPSDKIFQWLLPVDTEEITLQKASTASFFGAMCGIETRDRSLYLLVTNPSQIRMVRQWAKEMTGDDSANPFDKDVAEFSRFSGMARIQDGRWSELALEAVKLAPGIIRTASLTAQLHWCAGMTLTRGVWTQNDLEIELESEDVAKTLHMILENLGVRAIIYPALDTFSREKVKVALRDRLAQQTAQQILWRGYDFSPDWKGESVIDQVETHDYIGETLERAKEALREEGLDHLADSIEVEDKDKDNLKEVAEMLFPSSLKKKTFDRIYQTLSLMASPCTYLDRVTFSKATGVEVPMADLSVPIGSLYSTGGLVSHNSTLAMHLANQELADNPNSVVAFQDYEHSMAVNYARQMGLHKHNGRFLLIPSDEFEMADSLVKLFEEQKVFPSLWIIDSVPAMVPKAAFEREADENPQVALQARMFSDLLARWVKFAAKYGVTFLLLNQLRSNIQIGYGQRGKQTPGIFGSDKENQPGGFALRFYSSMTIDLRPSKIIKANVFNPMLGDREDIPIANMVRMTVSKNKCGSPYRSAMGYIQFGEGIDTVRTIIDLAISQRLITTAKGKGTHEIKLPDGKIFSVVGKEKLVQALKGQTHGRQGLEALDSLQKMLQWDKADEVHAQVLGMTEEIIDTGEEEEITGTAGLASEGLLELISSRDSLIEQADVLNMLTRRGKTIYWTNPETGIEYRGQRLELLEGKLGDEGYAALEKLVLSKIHEIESKLDEQEAAATSLPATNEEAVEEAVEGPTGSLEGFETEELGDGAPEDSDAPEGITEGSEDLLSSVFGENNSPPQEESGE
jgi:RecA/RadA recombinase